LVEFGARSVERKPMEEGRGKMDGGGRRAEDKKIRRLEARKASRILNFEFLGLNS
jgi:hypothetical protein